MFGKYRISLPLSVSHFTHSYCEEITACKLFQPLSPPIHNVNDEWYVNDPNKDMNSTDKPITLIINQSP